MLYACPEFSFSTHCVLPFSLQNANSQKGLPHGQDWFCLLLLLIWDRQFVFVICIACLCFDVHLYLTLSTCQLINFSHVLYYFIYILISFQIAEQPVLYMSFIEILKLGVMLSTSEIVEVKLSTYISTFVFNFNFMITDLFIQFINIYFSGNQPFSLTIKTVFKSLAVNSYIIIHLKYI